MNNFLKYSAFTLILFFSVLCLGIIGPGTADAQNENMSIEFGEPNDTIDNAHLLESTGRMTSFSAGLSGSDDLDYYKLTASPDGFGTWFQIDVKTIDPRKFYLFVEVLDPSGQAVVSEYASSESFWIALKAGVSTSVKIGQGSEWKEETPVSYDLVLNTGVMEDELENDDTKASATQLNYSGSKKAYMGAVLDAQGRTVGLSDWFKYDHRSCRNVCVYVTSNAYLALCASQYEEDCTGCNVTGNRLCVSNGCKGPGWGTAEGIRYVLVRPPEFEPRPYGMGRIPSMYTSPYTIRIVDTGPAFFEEKCNK